MKTENDMTEDKRLREVAQAILVISPQVDRLVIDHPAKQKEATELLKSLKTMKADVEERRQFFTVPLNILLKGFNAKAKELNAPILMLEGKLKAGLLKYNSFLEEEERKEQARQDKEAADKQAALDKANEAAENAETFDDAIKAEEKIEEVQAQKIAPVAEVRKTIRGGGGTVSIRKIWKHKVIDIAKVPREYLQLDDVLVRTAIRTGTRKIEGLEIYEQPITAIR